jgi:transglutaminase-like putative cysteine protease
MPARQSRRSFLAASASSAALAAIAGAPELAAQVAMARPAPPDAAQDPDLVVVNARVHTMDPRQPRDEAFAQFAQPSFSPGRPIGQAAWDLMQRIHRQMRYESLSTEVSTPALQALKQGKGVCQDFAHILVACCRSLGLPARYVSGYVLTLPPPGQARLIGCDASHAWAQVYCLPADTDGRIDGHRPGFWLDLDPTNDRLAAADYVTVATGRDFLDVSPLRGVIQGGSSHRLSVAVTVAPLESASAIQTPVTPAARATGKGPAP